MTFKSIRLALTVSTAVLALHGAAVHAETVFTPVADFAGRVSAAVV